MRRTRVGEFDRPPVVRSPIRVGDFGVPDQLMISAFGFDGDAQPFRSVHGPDLVAVAPVPSGVLHIIKQHKGIGQCDHVEIPAPGDVIRLNDRHPPAGIGHVVHPKGRLCRGRGGETAIRSVDEQIEQRM